MFSITINQCFSVYRNLHHQIIEALTNSQVPNITISPLTTKKSDSVIVISIYRNSSLSWLQKFIRMNLFFLAFYELEACIVKAHGEHMEPHNFFPKVGIDASRVISSVFVIVVHSGLEMANIKNM